MPRHRTSTSFTSEARKQFWHDAQRIVDPEDGKECFLLAAAAQHLGEKPATVEAWGRRNCRWLGRKIELREFLVNGRLLGYYVKDDLDSIIRAKESGIVPRTRRSSFTVRKPILAAVLRHFKITDPSDAGQYALPFADSWGTWLSIRKAAASDEYGVSAWSLGEAVRKKHPHNRSNWWERIGPKVRTVKLHGEKCHVRLIPAFHGFAPTLELAYVDSELRAVGKKRTSPKGVFTTGQLAEKYNGTDRAFWKRVFRGDHPATDGEKPNLESTVAANGKRVPGMTEADANKVYTWLKERRDRAPSWGVFRNPAEGGRVYLRPDKVTERFPYIRGSQNFFRLRKKDQRPLGRPIDSLELGPRRQFWLALNDLDKRDAHLDGEPTRPREDKDGTWLPLPAIVEESKIPEDVWYHYSRHARNLRRRDFFYVIKVNAGTRLVNKWRWYWHRDDVSGFATAAAEVANAGPIGPMLSAKEIAGEVGITKRHDRIALGKFLAGCAERGWIRRERQHRGWVNAVLPRRRWLYDYRQYRALMGEPLAKSASSERGASASKQPEMTGAENHAAQNRKRRGRPVDTDSIGDKRIADAWASGHYTKYADLARALGKKPRDVELALERDRWRRRQSDAPE